MNEAPLWTRRPGRPRSYDSQRSQRNRQPAKATPANARCLDVNPNWPTHCRRRQQRRKPPTTNRPRGHGNGDRRLACLRAAGRGGASRRRCSIGSNPRSVAHRSESGWLNLLLTLSTPCPKPHPTIPIRKPNPPYRTQVSRRHRAG